MANVATGMNQDVQAVSPSNDVAKLVAAVVLLVAGVAAYYHFADLPKLVRALMVVAGIAAAAGVALWSNRGRDFLDYARQTQIEVRKIVWPTRQETIQTTGAVVFIVILTALFLWLLDVLLSWATRWLLGHGG